MNLIDYILPSISAIFTMSVTGVIFGLVLSMAKIRLNVERDPRNEAVLNNLPGANCGACGQPGCQGYASKIVLGKTDLDLCPVVGADAVHKIAGIMGIKAGDGRRVMKARVHCQGGLINAKRRFIYEGPADCGAADTLLGGFLACSSGCLGLGNCKRACLFEAIEMDKNNMPVIDPGKCTGCGKCLTVCPRNIISLIPGDFEVWVNCMNTERASVMKSGCSSGCSGCRLCEKACKEVFREQPDISSAVSVDNFLAAIDYKKCLNCFKCSDACPVPAISPVDRPIKSSRGKLDSSYGGGKEVFGMGEART